MRDIKRISLPTLGLLLALPFLGTAQKLVLEKTYEVDKKAKKGFLDEVTINSTDKTTTLSFVTKASNNFTGSKLSVKYQDYIFDKDYNFVKVEEKEAEYRNKRYKGDNYSVEGISVEPNMLGKMVLRKKLIEYKWSWLNGGYNKKVTLLDKIKPKDEDGNSYMLIKKYENDETGEVIALVMAVGKTANINELFLMKIDKNLKMEVIDKSTFTTYKSLSKSFIIPAEVQSNDDEATVNEEDISESDMCFIFAGAPDKKNKDAASSYEMWRVSKEGKILMKTEFKVQASAWNIESVIAKNGSLYFVGPANDEPSSKAPDDIKWKYYQLAKFTKEKVDYITITNMDEFEAKLKKPASQKKNPAYKGKRFRFATANVSNDGSLFICGQNFKEAEFQDVLMFYFDNQGKLKAQYGVRLDEINSDSKARATRQYIDISGNAAYWTVLELSGFRKESGNGESSAKALIYPSIAKIDLGSAEINEFVKIGTVKDKPTYFLQNKFPFITNPADNSLIYLGVDKRGDVMWFGKVAFE
ncbi:MAG: hypothetical protein Q8M29_18565 [Bacteroidota bacterium]|nr:hypothetical protein [Bacteroidota bacterium]